MSVETMMFHFDLLMQVVKICIVDLNFTDNLQSFAVSEPDIEPNMAVAVPVQVHIACCESVFDSANLNTKHSRFFRCAEPLHYLKNLLRSLAYYSCPHWIQNIGSQRPSPPRMSLPIFQQFGSHPFNRFTWASMHKHLRGTASEDAIDGFYFHCQSLLNCATICSGR